MPPHLQRVAINPQPDIGSKIRVLVGCQSGNTVLDFPSASPRRYANQNQEECRQKQPCILFLLLAKDQERKKRNSTCEGDHPAARTGKENRCSHECGCGGRNPALASMGEAAESINKRYGREHLHQPGVMVVINVGAINPATETGRSKPIEFGWRTQVLQDSK